jgi:hypothetical protein
MKSKRRNQLKKVPIKLLLVFGSVLLTLLALELAVRACFSIERIPPSHNNLCCEFPNLNNLSCEYDELLGWRHIPNRTSLFYQSEHETTLSYNSQGFRGPEYDVEKPADVFRIAVLGDSFAECYTVEFEDLFSEVLRQNLKEQTGRKIEVMNFGVTGYSTDQQLLLFQEKVKLYNPDLTVLMFHDNDVWYNTMEYYLAWGYRYKPKFQLKNEALSLTNVPVPVPRPSRTTPREKLKNFLYEHSSLYHLTKQKIKGIPALYALAVKTNITDTPYASEENLIPKEYGIFQKTYSPQIRSAWEITGLLLDQLGKETEAIDSKLLVFYVPQKAAVYADQWENLTEYYSLEDDQWNREQPARELGNILEVLGIEYINPMQRMFQYVSSAPDDAEPLYFLIDGHWNEKGNQLVAEILTDYITQNYNLSRR